MKQSTPKQNAGIWLDNSKAIVITKAEDATEYTIHEKVKSNAQQGGGSEHSMNNAKNSDALKYFKEISGALLNYDEILIFGPGQSQEQLQNFLKEDNHFNNKKITIDSGGQLTDPQMIAKVREFFNY